MSFILESHKKEFIKQIYSIVNTIYNNLGCGYNETIYQNAICAELQALNVPFDKEATIPVLYKGHNIGFVRMDIVVYGQVPLVIEMKSIANIRAEERCQISRYLTLTNKDIGILINFPSTKACQMESIVMNDGKFYKYDVDSDVVGEV